MRTTHILIAMLPLMIISPVFAATTEPGFRVLRNGVVNDTVTDAVHPGGIAIPPGGKWLLTFIDKGDCAASGKVYFIESENTGKTWSKPYQIIEPENEKQGLAFNLYALGDGSILAAKNTLSHADSSQNSATKNFRTSKITMMISQDEGRNFTLLQELNTPDNSVVACMNSLVKLKNGDLILPAYCYPTFGRQPGAIYGSGFFRSTDGGKTWGTFELAFKEVAGTKPLLFNESAFAVKNDGSIVGFARIDSRPVNNMWKITSSDNGKTWTIPAETNIRGNFPEIKQLNNGLYLMVCGLVEKNCRPTVLFISKDGENYDRLGTVYYSRPEYNGGRPWGPGYGGTQSILPVGKDQAYVIFYGGDTELKGLMHTYIDSCLIEVKPAAEKTPGQAASASLPGGIKLEMNYVAPGSFMMKNTGTDANGPSNHKVTIANGYYLGKYEVTQAQYQAVMKINPSYRQGDNYPVENISWYDASNFCWKLTQLERQAERLMNDEIYRLPTETEWEFAARGGNSSQHYEFSGCPRQQLNEFAWYCGNSNYEMHEAGLKKANELGFYDMSGSVWEWTDDWHNDPADSLSYHNTKTIRGGGWNTFSGDCQVSSRSNVIPDKSMRSLGFRVLRTISN